MCDLSFVEYPFLEDWYDLVKRAVQLYCVLQESALNVVISCPLVVCSVKPQAVFTLKTIIEKNIQIEFW